MLQHHRSLPSAVRHRASCATQSTTGNDPTPVERSPMAGLRAVRNANRVRTMAVVRPFDGGSHVACAHASVPRCLVPAAAASRPRAVRAHPAGGQHARRSRPRISAGHLVAGKNDGKLGWLHGRLALVRRCLGPQPRLGLLEVSLDSSPEPGSHRHVFGRIVLGCPLSVASVVFRSIELDQLGNAVLPAATATAAIRVPCVHRGRRTRMQA